MTVLHRTGSRRKAQRHLVLFTPCPGCGKAFRTKDYNRSILRSVYGNVRIRVRGIEGCSCSGSQGRSEPRRDSRRRFCLSYATNGGDSSWA